MNYSKTWCVYPFIHLATFTNGSLSPCCVAKPYKHVNLNNLTIPEAWNHSEIQDLRNQLLTGQQPANCKNCFLDESLGVDSHRTSSNRVFKKEYNITQNNFNSQIVDISNLITFDLRLGNTCNLKCVMCRPNESHKWYDDIVKLQTYSLPPVVKQDLDYKSNYNRADYNWIYKNIFWENIDQILPNIKEFIFGGGEPFMLKEVKNLMKRAIELDISKDISIRFHTNGTYLTSEDFELFQHFKRIQLMFSIDGVDDINYFLRYPAKWDKIISNINENEKYGSNIESFILCTLTGVSAFYLNDLYNFVYNQQWKKLKVENIILGRVHHPTYLNPQILDLKRKQIITDKFNKIAESYPSVEKTIFENLNWINSTNESANINDLIQYIKSLCKVRSISVEILREFFDD